MILIGSVAFMASILTFFSGFGLGSLLLPAFAIFFPIEIAVGATAVVHFANNLAKMALVGKHGNWRTLKQFGVPAFIFSFLGSYCLLLVSELPDLFSYEAFGKEFDVPLHSFLIGILMIFFLVYEEFGKDLGTRLLDNLILGGSISGFFGGFSGHQGALRSMFLIRLGLTKEQFIATGIWIAVLVDFARLSIYRNFFSSLDSPGSILPLLLIGIASAILGAFLGKRLLQKVPLRFVNRIVGVGIFIIAILLMFGVI